MDVVVAFTDEDAQQTMSASDFFGSAKILHFCEEKTASMTLARGAIGNRVYPGDAVGEMKQDVVTEKGSKTFSSSSAISSTASHI